VKDPGEARRALLAAESWKASCYLPPKESGAAAPPPPAALPEAGCSPLRTMAGRRGEGVAGGDAGGGGGGGGAGRPGLGGALAQELSVSPLEPFSSPADASSDDEDVEGWLERRRRRRGEPGDQQPHPHPDQHQQQHHHNHHHHQQQQQQQQPDPAQCRKESTGVAGTAAPVREQDGGAEGDLSWDELCAVLARERVRAPEAGLRISNCFRGGPARPPARGRPRAGAHARAAGRLRCWSLSCSRRTGSAGSARRSWWRGSCPQTACSLPTTR